MSEKETKNGSIHEKLIELYKDIQFMFFTYRPTGNVLHFLLNVEKIKKHTPKIAVLYGEVVLGSERLKGNIHIDYAKNQFLYKHLNHRYDLEPDVRTKDKWSAFVEELRTSSQLL